MREQTAYIALGANLGDAAATLRRAVEMLDEVEGVRVERVSTLVRTKPVGGPSGQRDYVNGAVEVTTALGPRELLEALTSIERRLGRRRENEQRWGPRTCDLDLLLMGSTVMDTPDLTVPHPRMSERSFVLEPLAEIAPQAVHPVLGETAAELKDALARGEGGG